KIPYFSATSPGGRDSRDQQPPIRTKGQRLYAGRGSESSSRDFSIRQLQAGYAASAILSSKAIEIAKVRCTQYHNVTRRQLTAGVGDANGKPVSIRADRQGPNANIALL